MKYPMILNACFTLSLFAAASCSSPDSASNAKSEGGVAGSFFSSHEPLSLTLKAEFSKTFQDAHIGPANTSGEEPIKASFPVQIEYTDSRGTLFSVAAQSKIRGERTLTACAFPKIKLKLAKEDIAKAPLFEGAHNLKVGTHCNDRDGIDGFGKIDNDKGNFRESFVYHLFPLLGIDGQKSRPAVITYVESSNGSSLTRQAFLFEDADLLAKRLGGKALESADGNFTADQAKRFDRSQAAVVSLFEAFIGNWDYVIDTQDWQGNQALYAKNVEILELADGRIVPIASDFDLSAMVSGYVGESSPLGGMSFQKMTKDLAEANIETSLNRLVDRFTKEELKQASIPFQGKKDELLKALTAYPMDDEGRSSMAIYIEAFYQKLPLILN